MLSDKNCEVGAEVICVLIPNVLYSDDVRPCFLKKGEIYTITSFIPDSKYGNGVTLAEIGPTQNFGVELFRPLAKNMKMFYDMVKAPLDPMLATESDQPY